MTSQPPDAQPAGPTRPERSVFLTVNGGSSSLKFALFTAGDPLERIGTGVVERIGLPGGRFHAKLGAHEETRPVEAADSRAAVEVVIDWLRRTIGLGAVAAVGHRVVHGGSRFSRPERISTSLVDELRRISPFDPDHLPGEIAMIEAFLELDPEVPQLACFDTAFHHDLPRVARIVPVPRRFEALGLRRYGFHGLSYTYLMEELARLDGPDAAKGRVVLAHLGSGASLAAVRDGRCVETTMGLTPAGGIVMGTRSGDLDPGVLTFLARADSATIDRLDAMVNHESGLLGVSETSPDVRDLLARRGSDERAAEAIDLFCYRARLAIGALAAALGGLDTLVFSGGIGENAPAIRAEIVEGLGFLGVLVDPARNEAGSSRLSPDGARVAVRMIRTDEERTIARALAEMVRILPPRSGS
jgi:acetate kinase